MILDAKNRLDIRVRRAVQPPAEMQQRRMYTVSSNSERNNTSFLSMRQLILLGSI